MAAEKRATDAGLSSQVQILRQSICSMQVCAPKSMSADDVAAEANNQTPWEIVPESTLHWEVAPEQPNPITCAENSDRQHWLLFC